MEQATADNADQRYAGVFEYFTQGMSRIFNEDKDEHAMLADELGAYVKRSDGYTRGKDEGSRGFEVIYSQITQRSVRLGVEPEYFTKWLFENYKDRNDFMRKLRGDVPARQPFAMPRPLGYELRRPARAVA
ncbi:MAG: hypothetical protein NT016_03765 [Candidatus Aenigmarchaeota archaeon]|nr:hypothetical protein [Candidatus Aenigmarchaeota archaeon]